MTDFDIQVTYRGIQVPNHLLPDLSCEEDLEIWRGAVDAALAFVQTAPDQESNGNTAYFYARDRDGWYLRGKLGGPFLCWDAWNESVHRSVTHRDTWEDWLQSWGDEAREISKQYVPPRVLQAFEDYEG